MFHLITAAVVCGNMTQGWHSLGGKSVASHTHMHAHKRSSHKHCQSSHDPHAGHATHAMSDERVFVSHLQVKTAVSLHCLLQQGFTLIAKAVVVHIKRC